MATCPKCAQSFEAVDPDKEPPPPPAPVAAHQAAVELEDEEEEEQEAAIPSWINPWGAAAFGLATLALLQATLVGFRFLTVLLALAGSVLVGLGIRATGEDRKTRDQVWFYISGVLNGAILILALFLPGVLNSWWALDRPAPSKDPNKLVLVPRDKTQEEGQPLGADDWADASTEAIRQDDVLVRVESVKVGPVADKGTDSRLLVHLRLANVGQGKPIPFEGFGGKHEPKLTDESGGSFAFQEQRLRKPARGAPVFEASGPRTVEVQPMVPQDVLLIFEAPPKTEGLRLEIPSSAWGRKGVCKLRIPALFDSGLPEKK
jgi:hypothetical protein